MGKVIWGIVVIAIPMVAVGIIYLATDSFTLSTRGQWSKLMRRLRGLLILVIPALLSIILYKYYDFNPVTVFVRALALQWGMFWFTYLGVEDS